VDLTTTIILSGLGALILVGIVASFKNKRQEAALQFSEVPPAVGNVDKLFEEESVSKKRKIDEPDVSERKTDSLGPLDEAASSESRAKQTCANQPLAVFHLMAPKGKFFGGYDLLQALLSQGLRFGEMKIFHRFQDKNGRGPILFSLAQATEPGTFNIHHMGSLNCKGLTLFMQLSGCSGVDSERFSLMVDSLKALKKELGGQILDDEKKEVSHQALERCKELIRDMAAGESA
jgi:cell division protein ZipA